MERRHGIRSVFAALLVGSSFAGNASAGEACPYGPIRSAIPGHAVDETFADVTGDGIVDFVGVTEERWLEVYAGSRDGTFHRTWRRRLAGFASVLGACDLDGDGRADLVVREGDEAQDIVVWRGSPDGSFVEAFRSRGGTSFEWCTIDDLDGDGTVDLLTAGVHHGKGRWFSAGLGDGTFAPVVDVLPEVSATLLTIGEMDGDPDREIALLGRQARDSPWRIQVWKAFGAGPPALLCTRDFEETVDDRFAFDVDGDGLDDLFLPARKGQEPAAPIVIRSLGGGEFADPITLRNESGLPWRAGAVRPLALDAEGRVELLLSARPLHMVSIDRIDWDRGTISVLSAIRQSYGGAAGPRGRELAVFDVDGDGLQDFLASSYETIATYFGTVLGTARGFDAGLVAAPELADVRIAAALSEDEIVVTTGCSPPTCGVGVARVADGAIAMPERFATARLSPGDADFSHRLEAGDVDGDGRLDLVSLTDSELLIATGNADGTFTDVATGEGGLLPLWRCQPGTLAVDDLDGDGRDEIVLVGEEDFDQEWFHVYGFELTDAGELRQVLEIAHTVRGYSLACDDVDGDGQKDLVVPISSSYVRVLFLESRSLAGFVTLHPGVPSGTDALVGDIVTGDFDGDGNVDVACGHNMAGVTVFFGLGGRTFGPPRPFFRKMSAQGTWLETGDLDDDGADELLGILFEIRPAGDLRYHFLFVVWGDASRTLDRQCLYSGDGINPVQAPVLRDVDGDRLPELITSDLFVRWNRSIGPPVADFRIEGQQAGYAPLRVELEFTGDLGGDSDGSIQWDFGGGDHAEGTSVVRTFENDTREPVDVPVTLLAQNRKGIRTSTAFVTVYPRLSFDFEAIRTEADPLCLAFRESDASSFIVRRLWLFGDGARGSTPSPEHCFPRSGIYDAACIVEGPFPGHPGNSVTVLRQVEAGYIFLRGDADGDGRVTLDDAIHIAHYLYLGTPPLGCLDAFDADDNARLDVVDVVFLARLLFHGGSPCPEPYPEAGIDPTADAVECR